MSKRVFARAVLVGALGAMSLMPSAGAASSTINSTPEWPEQWCWKNICTPEWPEQWCWKNICTPEEPAPICWENICV